jgi:hypothetical protein
VVLFIISSFQRIKAVLTVSTVMRCAFKTVMEFQWTCALLLIIFKFQRIKAMPSLSPLMAHGF